MPTLREPGADRRGARPRCRWRPGQVLSAGRDPDGWPAGLVPRRRLGARRPRQPRRPVPLDGQPRRVLRAQRRLPAGAGAPVPRRRRRRRHRDAVGAASTPPSSVRGDRRRRGLGRRQSCRVVANDRPAPICFQLLVYPATDARMVHPSHDENAEGYFLTAAGIRWFSATTSRRRAAREIPDVAAAR